MCIHRRQSGLCYPNSQPGQSLTNVGRLKTCPPRCPALYGHWYGTNLWHGSGWGQYCQYTRSANVVAPQAYLVATSEDRSDMVPSIAVPLKHIVVFLAAGQPASKGVPVASPLSGRSGDKRPHPATPPRQRQGTVPTSPGSRLDKKHRSAEPPSLGPAGICPVLGEICCPKICPKTRKSARKSALKPGILPESARKDTKICFIKAPKFPVVHKKIKKISGRLRRPEKPQY